MNEIMDDQQIIELFWKRDEAAISGSHAKYGIPLKRISFRILSSHEDSEECLNDTYMKAWTSIPPQRPGCLFAYLGRIIRNLSLNRWQKNRAEKRGGPANCLLLSELSECIPSPRTVEHETDETFLTETLVSWLRGLPAGSRVLFLRRYWYGDSLSELAEACGIPVGRLAGRMFRLRKSLKIFLEKEGITL